VGGQSPSGGVSDLTGSPSGHVSEKTGDNAHDSSLKGVQNKGKAVRRGSTPGTSRWGVGEGEGSYMGRKNETMEDKRKFENEGAVWSKRGHGGWIIGRKCY